MSFDNGHSAAPVDYDLHGMVGIRLLGATPRETAVITQQIGPIQTRLKREPDIIIRFVDRLPTSSRIRYLGVNDAGFTDDAFLVLRSKHKAQARVQIPLDKVGQQCEIVCERGLPAVPLLIAIINLTALSKGFLPMHASAFTYKGIGALATGWAKGGKTETLLAFADHGAEYVGDEWVYLSRDGRQMYGIPEPIRIWDWHLQELPEYWALVKRGDRARLRGLNMLVRSMDKVASSGIGQGLPPMKIMKRAAPILKRQLYVHLPPRTLFGQDNEPMTGSLDKIFFVASHETADIIIRPMDPQEIARRMVFSLQEERTEFMTYYMKFRFAFPEASNELIEQTEAIQRDLLMNVLCDKEAYSVYHPYPVSIPAMYEAISPFFEK